MFWNKFDTMMGRESSVHEILTGTEFDKVQLKDLLAKEDIIQETKARNATLVKVLLRPDILLELIKLITEEPPGEIGAKDRFKEATIACEVLNADVPEMVEALVRTPEYLDVLLGLFEHNECLNPIVTSFVSRTLGLLISRKPWDVLDYLIKKDNLLDITVKHLNVSAVADLYLRLITGHENDVYRYRVCEWLDAKQMIQKVAKYLDATFMPDSDYHVNAAQLIADVIRFSREQQLQQLKPEEEISQLTPESHANQLLRTADSEEFIQLIVDNLCKSTSSQTALVQCLGVLGAPFEFIPVNFDGNSEQRLLFAELSLIVVNARIERLSKIIEPAIPKLHEILLNPPMRNTLIGQMADGETTLTNRVGQVRLQVVRLLALLLSFGRSRLNQAIFQSGNMITLIDMFFRFPYNSFFHSHIQNCIGLVLRYSPMNFSEPINVLVDHPLLYQILVTARLKERIMTAWTENAEEEKLGKPRRPFMGHLILISAELARDAATNPLLATLNTLVEEKDEDGSERWFRFLLQIIQPLIQLQSRCLGGIHPTQENAPPPGHNLAGSEYETYASPDPRDARYPDNHGKAQLSKLEAMDIASASFDQISASLEKVNRSVDVMKQDSQDSDEDDEMVGSPEMRSQSTPPTQIPPPSSSSPRKVIADWPETQPLNASETDGIKRMEEAENSNSPWDSTMKVDNLLTAWDSTTKPTTSADDDSWADFSNFNSSSFPPNTVNDLFKSSVSHLTRNLSDPDDTPIVFKASHTPEAENQSPVEKESENVFGGGDVIMESSSSSSSNLASAPQPPGQTLPSFFAKTGEESSKTA